MNEAAPSGSEPNWLESLAAEFLDGQASFDFPLGDGVDPFASDDPLLPPLTFSTSSDESMPGQRASPGDPAIAPDALLQPGAANGLGLVPMPHAQADGMHLLPVQGYMPVGSQQQPHEPPSLQQTSMGAASVSSSERWAGYDASGSSGAHRASSNGSAGAPMPAVPSSSAGSEDLDKVSNTVQKFKEKNRAAQRRYRERQKEKLMASEEKVAELQQQLQKMRLEQETLAQRNALLERLLTMQQQAAAQVPTPTGTRAAIEGQQDAWWLDKQMKVYMEQAMQLGGELVFTVRKAAPIRLTQAQVAGMSHGEFGDLWREYMNAFAECLLEMHSDENSPAGQRLTRLVFEAGQLKGAILMSFPDRIHALQKRTYGHQSGLPDKPITDEGWAQMAESARLSDLQRETIIKLRDLYLRNVGILARRRKQLTATLQNALPMSSACGDGGVTDNKYSHTLGTMDELRDTLRDEHSCLMQFVLTIWRRVLKPHQAAHLNISAYPANADVLRVSEVLARAAGHPYSCSVMQQGANDPNGQLVPVDAALPESMRRWEAPPVDLAALYPGLVNGSAAAATGQEGSAARGPDTPPAAPPAVAPIEQLLPPA